MVFYALSWAQTPADNPVDPDADARLNRRVSVVLVAEPLRKVMAELEQQTGVRLSTASTIGEYRACLAVKDRPLHEVMRKLQQAFGFRWKVDGDQPDQYRYQFYQPTNEREAELRYYEQVRWGEIERLRRFIEKNRRALQEGRLIEMAQAHREEVKRLRNAPIPNPLSEQLLREYKESNPFSVSPYGVEQLALAYMLAQAGDKGFKLLKEGLPLQASTRDPSTRKLVPPNLPQAIVWHEVERQKWMAEANPDSPYADLIRQSQQERIKRIQGASDVSLWFQMDPETLSGEFQIVLYDEAGKVVHKSADTIGFHFDGLLDERRIAASLRRFNPAPSPPDAPAFATKLTPFKREQTRWWHWHAYRLVQAAQESGLSLVMEFYPLYGEWFIMVPTFADDWATLLKAWYQQLYDWQYEQSGWLVLSHAQRALARLTDVPESIVERFMSKPVDDLDQLARLSQLSGGQIIWLTAWVMACSRNVPEPKLYPYFYSLSLYLQNLRDKMPAREAVRLYASLTDGVRQRLKAGQTIPLQNLSSESRKHLMRLLSSAKRTGGSGDLEQEETPSLNQVVRMRIVRQTSPYSQQFEFAPIWVTGPVTNPSEWLRTVPEEVRIQYRLFMQSESLSLIFEGDSERPLRISFTLYRHVEPSEKPPSER
jgi:hypothetical protein